MKDIVETNMKPKYISRYSPTIQNLVKEQMQQEIEKLGFYPFGDGAQDEYERRVLNLEQESLDNPNIDWEIKHAELTAHRFA